jgi:hypothetical protein
VACVLHPLVRRVHVVSYILRQVLGAPKVRVRVRGPIRAALELAREWAKRSRNMIDIFEGEPFAVGNTLPYYRINRHGTVFARVAERWRAVDSLPTLLRT